MVVRGLQDSKGAAKPSALAPFRIPSFRYQWPADLLTSWAFEMETLILGWYVLVETDSLMLLTVFGSLQFLGTLIAPMLGVAGDRVGCRAMLCSMRAFYTVQASLIMTLGLTGLLEPVFVFAIAFLMGLVRPSDLVMRNSLIGDTIPLAYLGNAMGVSRTTQDSARIVGALVGAGLFSALGIGPAYVAVASFYGLSFLLTLRVSSVRAERETTDLGFVASAWRDLLDGIRYVWTTPQVLALMWLAFLVNLTAFPICNSLLPYVAREVYLVDENGLGHLVAGYAGGALVASLIMAATGGGRRSVRMMLAAIAIWYGLLMLFGQMETKAMGLPLLILVGIAQGIGMVSMSVTLLSTVSARYRGRVQGVRMLCVYSLPLGLLAAGVVIEQIGYAATVALYSTIGLLMTALIAWKWRAALAD